MKTCLPRVFIVTFYSILAYQIWYSIRTNDIYQTALWGVVLGIQINMTIVSLQLGRKKKEIKDEQMLELSDLPYTQAEALDILQHCPRWMGDGGYHATMQSDTRLYNPRTQTFCNRSLHLCVTQMEAGAEEEMHFTQQYHSSMYDEMVEVSALEKLAGVTLKEVLADEANYKLPVAPVDDEGELVSDEDLLAEEIETLKELQSHVTKFHTRKNFRASLARALKRLESIASESTSV